MQPHICYILKRFPRLSQTFVLNELLALRRLGLRITVVSLRHGDAGHAGYAELDAPVRYLDSLAPATPDDPAAAAALAPLLEGWGVTHIHAHFATRAARVAERAAAASGLPFSFTAHAHDIFHAGVDDAALAALIERADFVITVSEYNRRYLAELLRAEGRVGRVLRLYNGVDMGRLQPAGAPGRGPVVGVGRLTAKKGFADLVAAAGLLRDSGRPTRVAIVGEGEERPALERQIAELGLGGQVELLGARPPAETLAIMAGASALALPCAVGADGDRDGLPTVLLEAMALGTPVISTDVAGVPELVQHGCTGLLAREGDPASLAAAIARLLDDAGLGERLRRAARERVCADFDIDKSAARLARHFTDAARQAAEVGAPSAGPGGRSPGERARHAKA